jgi:hypothetical protein
VRRTSGGTVTDVLPERGARRPRAMAPRRDGAAERRWPRRGVGAPDKGVIAMTRGTRGTGRFPTGSAARRCVAATRPRTRVS